MLYAELDTPAVVVDLDVLESNITRMADRARSAGVRLRPHAKTHKSAWIAHRQIEAGAGGLTVAKLGEAETFAAAGVDDVLVAYPLVGAAKLARLRALAQCIRVITVLDDLAVARGLAQVGASLDRPLEVMVEVDSGLHRCGRAPGAESAQLAAAVAAMSSLRLLGLMTHAGHVYRAMSVAEREAIALGEGRALVDTADALKTLGVTVAELSIGSSPTAASIATVARAFPSITELRPGTYVFNDVNQIGLGVANEQQCALRVVTTVVSRPGADRMVVDAGSKTLAAETGNGRGYGRVVGRPELLIEALSEEHAVVRVPFGSPWRVGDRIEIIPNHACPVPNLADQLIGVRAGRVVQTITVDGRGQNG